MVRDTVQTKEYLRGQNQFGWTQLQTTNVVWYNIGYLSLFYSPKGHYPGVFSTPSSTSYHSTDNPKRMGPYHLTVFVRFHN